MEVLGIRNPFPDGRCYLASRVESTQDEAKRLARAWDVEHAEPDFPVGSLVAAEEQGAGRGRIPGRRWLSDPGASLLFTLRLPPEAAILSALPLRIGAALCRAVSGLASAMGASFPEPPRIKWPNDLMLGNRKASGILCEASALGVFAGIGVNCARLPLPPEIALRATSLEAELGLKIDRWALLEIILVEIRSALDDAQWRSSLRPLLWRLGEEVSFIPGPAAYAGPCRAAVPLRARLAGVAETGALALTLSDGRVESFLSGELTAAHPNR